MTLFCAGAAVLGWAAALGLLADRLARQGRRYLLRSLWWRWRAPAGHRSHLIVHPEGAYPMPSCECGFTERTLSVGSAEGALLHHLRHARRWEHYTGATPCPGEPEHGLLTDADVLFLQDHDRQLAAADRDRPAAVTTMQ